MIEAYKKMMKNYANFNGRTNRKDFWLAVLAYFIIEMVVSLPGNIITIISNVSANTGTAAGAGVGGVLAVIGIIFSLLSMLVSLAHIVPVLAIEVRRLHDINKSGWFILIGLASICCGIGFIILLVFYCFDSVEEGKQYGDYV
jgi:uncharacterized membrane protein YhaH (DUF805 family)